MSFFEFDCQILTPDPIKRAKIIRQENLNSSLPGKNAGMRFSPSTEHRYIKEELIVAVAVHDKTTKRNKTYSPFYFPMS